MAIIAAATTATTTATKMGSRRERGDRHHQQQQQVEEDQDVRQATEEGLQQQQQQQQRQDNGKAAAVDDGHGQDVVMPGFRFHPTEEELVEFYLRRKVEGKRFNVELITFLDLYRYDPWELPALAAIGEKEWFFYVPRDRKYRNGDRPNRVTTSGYWKATGADRMIRNENNSRPIGLKKTLVFYSGKAPKGVRTSWIMNEYRLPQTAYDSMDVPSQKAEISLCRVYKRPGVEDHHQHSSSHRPASMSSRTSSASKKQDAYSPAQHQIPTSFHGLPPSDSPVSASPEAFIVERMHQESIGAGTSDSTNMADVMVAAAHAAAYAPDPMATATAVVTGPASDLQLVGDHTLRRLQRHDPGRLLLSSTSATRSVPTCSTTTFGAPAGYGGIPIPPPGTISSINNQTCSTSASTSVDNPLAAIDELSRFMEYHHQAQQQNQNHHHHHHNYYQQSAYLLQQPQPQPHQNQQLLPSHQPITHPPAMLPFTSSMAAALTAFPEKLWEWNLIPDAGSASAARDYSTAYK